MSEEDVQYLLDQQSKHRNGNDNKGLFLGFILEDLMGGSFEEFKIDYENAKSPTANNLPRTRRVRGKNNTKTKPQTEPKTFYVISSTICKTLDEVNYYLLTWDNNKKLNPDTKVIKVTEGDILTPVKAFNFNRQEK